MRVFLALLFWACLSSCNASDDIYGPAQPGKGPGGSDYQHAKVRITDRAEGANGYWVFQPANPTPDSADVVVMNHGWGAYNPASYGGWIRHIVRKGSIVIYTRYQYSMATLPRYFNQNAETEITASHGEILSVFDRYNSGHGNPVIWRARWASQTNAVDYFCYWKLFDALKACALAAHYCNYAFGNTEEQRYMGQWSDGTPVKELTVLDTLE
ncbi:MAG: hypothetical protein BRD50_08495 [Bacteroidetes bacterium SW_11_45_7]|nr:MAG: hypothetical protein BRD50_08495 [Bacteroidetes bacterium SW_11_45_7]